MILRRVISASSGRHDLKKSRGFTLIELVMVMVMIGIVAVVATPLFQNPVGTRSQAAALRLSSDIRYAQMLAIQTQRTVRVIFDAATNSYQIEILEAAWNVVMNPGTHGNYIVQLNSGDFQNVTLSEVNFNGASEIRFDRVGVPTDNNNPGFTDPAYVKLSGLFQVSVAAVTGKVDVTAL